MKKLLTLLLTLLMVFTLVGCNDKKEEEPVVVDVPELNEVEVEDEPIVGGFIEVEDRTLTDELKEIFNKACEGYTGIGFEPQELYATQVVAGTNYKFVCSGTKTTNPPIKGTYFVTVYKDLQGNCSIIDVETITESTGDVVGDSTVKKEVDKTINYWVVFYDQYGNELQREALKYGTVPSYKGNLPEGFDNWDKSLKAITGNTYIHAVCHEVTHQHSSPAGPSDCDYTPTQGVNEMIYKILSIDAANKAHVDKYKYNGSFFVLNGTNTEWELDTQSTHTTSELSIGKYYHYYGTLGFLPDGSIGFIEDLQECYNPSKHINFNDPTDFTLDSDTYECQGRGYYVYINITSFTPSDASNRELEFEGFAFDNEEYGILTYIKDGVGTISHNLLRDEIVFGPAANGSFDINISLPGGTPKTVTINVGN